MQIGHLTLTLLLLASFAHAQAGTPSSVVSAKPSTLQPLNKGLTLQATVWPSYENNWAGRFSCNNCDPFVGDQPCSKALPILCISNAKVANRPWYNIQIQYTPFAVTDGGYYDGWTGGVLRTTLPVRGADITSYAVGDNLCKGYFGDTARFATFDQGFYMPYMNEEPIKTQAFWDWSKAKNGGWNFWGYFGHSYRGRAWVWVKGQPNGNCGN